MRQDENEKRRNECKMYLMNDFENCVFSISLLVLGNNLSVEQSWLTYVLKDRKRAFPRKINKRESDP